MQRSEPKPTLLHLMVSPDAFEVMATGEKWQEYRKGNVFPDLTTPPDFLLIATTTPDSEPYFICKFNGYQTCANPIGPITYSNGYKIPGVAPGDIIIYLGPIVETGNLKSK